MKSIFSTFRPLNHLIYGFDTSLLIIYLLSSHQVQKKLFKEINFFLKDYKPNYSQAFPAFFTTKDRDFVPKNTGFIPFFLFCEAVYISVVSISRKCHDNRGLGFHKPNHPQHEQRSKAAPEVSFIALTQKQRVRVPHI